LRSPLALLSRRCRPSPSLAAAAIEYPWCVSYGDIDGGGGKNCGFVSYEQCMMTARGAGGSCDRNLFYPGTTDQPQACSAQAPTQRLSQRPQRRIDNRAGATNLAALSPHQRASTPRAVVQPPRFNIDQAMQEAVGLHRAGRLREAEKIYVRIVKAAPDYFDALHLLGSLKAQAGQMGEALRLNHGRAQDQSRRAAERVINLANVMHALKRDADALDCLDKAVISRSASPIWPACALSEPSRCSASK